MTTPADDLRTRAKVLTLWQPWASLVALGVKTIETRSWSTKYRGPLAIHAAKAAGFAHGTTIGDWRAYRADGKGRQGGQADRMYHRAPGWATRPETPVHLPPGVIVATCELVDVVPIVTAMPPQHEWVNPWACITVEPWLILERWRGFGSAHGDYVGDQLPYGDFTPGRFAWLLANVVPIEPPVPFTGGQGLSRSWTSC